MSCTARLTDFVSSVRPVPTGLYSVRRYRCTPVHSRRYRCTPVHSRRAHHWASASKGRSSLQQLSAASDPDFDSAGAEGIEEEPEDARGAIAVGLKYYKAGDYQKALELFGSAPALPGTGTKRFR